MVQAEAERRHANDPHYRFSAEAQGLEARRRHARTAEIAAHMEAGGKAVQNGSVWPECSPFENYSFAELGKHLEAREYGFGWPVVFAP